MTALTINSVTATSVTLALGGLAVDGSVLIQYGSDPTFEFCVAPSISVPRSSPYVASGLNQDATYYARARNARGDGTLEAWGEVVGFKTPVDTPRTLAVGPVVIDPVMLVIPLPVLQWSAGNEQPGYIVKNLGRDAPVAWRSVSGGAHVCSFRIASTPVDTIAVLQSNIPEAMSIKVRGGASQAAVNSDGTAAYVQNFPNPRVSANMPGRAGYHALLRLASAQQYPWWQLEFTGVVPGDMLHVEHVVVGLNRSSKNLSIESKETPLNLGGMERTRTGQPDRQRGIKMRRMEFDISAVHFMTAEPLYADLWRRIEDTVLIAPNSKADAYLHDRLLFGDLKVAGRSFPTSIHSTQSFAVESLI